MIVLDGKISRGDATRALNEGKKVSERGDGNIYIDDEIVGDFTDIDAKLVEMQAEYDAQEYARNRPVGKAKTFKEITTTVTDDQGVETEVKSIVVDKEAINGYPDIGDQLDDLYHAGVFSADMTAKLKKVKDDFPKPS